MNIKAILKKIPGVQALSGKFESIPARFRSSVSPAWASKYVYQKRLHKPLNLSNPVLYNEKLMWLKLYYYNKNVLVTECADKFRVRNYVERCGLGKSLNELYGVWNSVDDIVWEELPQQFVLKCNHGCDYNIICQDKNKLNIEESKRKLKTWQKDNFWKNAAEVNYRYISRCIVCEKYLGTVDGKTPADIKVYCFNGVPEFVGYYYDRPKNTHAQKRGYFDFEWKAVPFMHPRYNSELPNIDRPEWLDRVWNEAKILSSPFPFVRVDFFEYEGNPIFAELTFTPLFCAGDMFTDEGMRILGEKIKLPTNAIN